MSDEQARQLLHHLQALESYATEMAQREAGLAAAMREAASAIESARAAGGGQPEALVPLGLGAFARASLPAGGGIVVAVGAGAAIEMDADSAANYLEARLKEIEVSLQDASARKHDALARIEQGRQQVDALAASMQGGRPPAPAQAGQGQG